MDPEFLADPDPNSGKKVWSGSGQKDPDPKHWFILCPPHQLHQVQWDGLRDAGRIGSFARRIGYLAEGIGYLAGRIGYLARRIGYIDGRIAGLGIRSFALCSFALFAL